MTPIHQTVLVESLPRTLAPGLAVVLVATLAEDADDDTHPPIRTITPVALLVARPEGIERIEVELGAYRSAVESAWTELTEAELEASLNPAFGQLVLDERSAQLTVCSVRWPGPRVLGAYEQPRYKILESCKIEMQITHRSN